MALTACCSLIDVIQSSKLCAYRKENLLSTFYKGRLTTTSEAFVIFPWILIILGAPNNQTSY